LPKQKIVKLAQGLSSFLKLYRPQLWKLSRTVAALIVTTIGLVAAIVAIQGGPFWPTRPTFAPTYSSQENPLSVPFTVTNSSTLFGLDNLAIQCVLVSVDIMSLVRESTRFIDVKWVRRAIRM
jgi:hypothetical protein